jgi:hypothetical protein
MARYAAGTEVPADRSKAEVERLLVKNGADQFSSGWTDEKAVIMFRMKERYIRIEMPIAVYMKTQNQRGYYLGTEQVAQENRRRWRALLLYVKAKLESVESEIVSFEEAFMAHVVLPNRQTVSQFMHPQIESAYGSGQMPKALPGY